MELLEKENQQLLSLKSKLFDILTLKDEKQLGEVLSEFVHAIKTEFLIRDVTLYIFNESRNFYFPKASTMKSVIEQPEVYKIDKDEMDDLFTISNHSNPQSKQLSALIPLYHKETIVGSLTLGLNTERAPFFSKEMIRHIGIEGSKFLDWLQHYYKITSEELRYEQLFSVTAKFHSSMDIDDVLEEIIMTLKNVYPAFTYYLLLSHDNGSNQTLPIKDLKYHNYESSPAIQAYVTGEIQVEESLENTQPILYAPLKGKQGVYGVLEVISGQSIVFTDNELNFIELLANTAGSALENAQLYQQSKRLVADLQLINETTHSLNSNLRLNDTISFMSQQIKRSFKASEVGFIMLGSGGRHTILTGSTTFFVNSNPVTYIDYVKSKVTNEKDTLFVGDLQGNGLSIYRSLMAVPMVHSGDVKGIAIVLDENPYYFSFDTFKLFQSLIHHSTLAFTNSMLREELENLVITDHLTKLYTRNYLDEKVKTSMESDGFGTFILIDIDDFKCINDTYGHQIGDTVIVQVANLIKNNIRDSDVGTRWGGEELAIYLPRVELGAGSAIAKRLVEKVKSSTTPQVTISCGIANWRKEVEDTAQQLFHRADKALYRAKDTGKNQVIIYDELVFKAQWNELGSHIK